MRTSLLALTALAAASASAATVSYNATQFAAGNSTYVNFGLSQFDTSLGELTGVTLTVNKFSIQGSFTATATSGSGTLNLFSATANLRQNSSNLLGFTAQSGSESTDDNLIITPSAGLFLNEGESQVFSITEFVFLTNSSTTITSDFWSAYQGNGNILFQIRNSPVASMTAETASFSTAAATSFADLTVTYTYTAAPIPEPSTYGLILGGLALAGAAIRRRQAKSSI